MQKTKRVTVVASLFVVLFTAVVANAGGPLMMWNKEQRIPYRWDVSSPVRVFTDSGPFEIIPSQFTPIPNEVADAAVAFSIGQWNDVESSSFQAQIIGDFASIGLPDINSPSNAGLVIGPDNGGGVHVIYDQSGTIMRDFLGAPVTVLGIAQPEWADETTGTITESWVLVNSQLRWVGDDQLQNFRAIFTHEFGHAINLAHSQTNGAILQKNDARGPLTCATALPYSTAITPDDRETMYPFLNVKPGTGNGLQMATVNVSDDKTSVSNLYPAPGYPETHGSITGRILKTDGSEGITGVNVIVRNLDNPYTDAISAMSGDYVRVAAGNDGTFTINGLTPGARYVIYNDMIIEGGYPTKQPEFLPEGEEFFNGENESGNGLTDDRCQMTPIVAAAGSVAQADIVLNTVQGAPKFTPLTATITVNSVSSDGNIISGILTSGGTYRFTEVDGHQVLNTTPGAVSGTMSRDGSFFVSDTLNAANKRVASILQYPGGSWQQLPIPTVAPPAMVAPADYVTVGWGIAEYGRAVAGSVAVDTNGPLPGETGRARPFIWTPENGSRELPVPAGTRNARPNNISADGSTVLGWYDFPNSNSTRFGARWVNGEFIPFTTPSLFVGEANASTPDGSVILGRNAGPKVEAWYWTQEKGVQLLGRFGTINSSSANAVSADGQVIAGFGGSVAQFPGDVSGHRAFLWTPELGFVDFEKFLSAQGTGFEGWIVNSTNSMTPDGMRFVGSGYAPNKGLAGWIIDLPTVNICHAPPGNPRNTQTINVPFRGDMGDHLKHGDTIGVCTQ